MNRSDGPEAHPSDGELVRFLDRELSDLQDRRLRTHLNGCAPCTERVDALRAESEMMASMIARTQVDGPDELTRARALSAARRARVRASFGGRRSSRAIMAAAVVLVLAVAAFPARAWIADGWRALRGDAGTSEATNLPATSVYRSSVVAFEPEGPQFELDIQRFQAEGTLTVQVRDVPRASAQILDGSEETMLVLPNGLRVENTGASAASYLVTVPADVPLVRIEIGGKVVSTLSIDPRAVPWSRTFSLAEGDAGVR